MREKRKNHGREVGADAEDIKPIQIKIKGKPVTWWQVMNFRYVDELKNNCTTALTGAFPFNRGYRVHEVRSLVVVAFPSVAIVSVVRVSADGRYGEATTRGHVRVE